MSADEVRAVAGLKSEEVAAPAGRAPEVIHRDEFVLDDVTGRGHVR